MMEGPDCAACGHPAYLHSPVWGSNDADHTACFWDTPKGVGPLREGTARQALEAFARGGVFEIARWPDKPRDRRWQWQPILGGTTAPSTLNYWHSPEVLAMVGFDTCDCGAYVHP